MFGPKEIPSGAFSQKVEQPQLTSTEGTRPEQPPIAVHPKGGPNVVRAAERAGVQRLALVSLLRARPDCGSRYHESKWAAEEIVRRSQLEWTVLKPGMMFGRGDRLLDHLSRALRAFPVSIGVRPRRVDLRPSRTR